MISKKFSPCTPVESNLGNPFLDKKIKEDPNAGDELGFSKKFPHAIESDRPGWQPRIKLINTPLLGRATEIHQRDVLFIVEEFLRVNASDIYEGYTTIVVKRICFNKKKATIGIFYEFREGVVRLNSVTYQYSLRLGGVLEEYCKLKGYSCLDL